MTMPVIVLDVAMSLPGRCVSKAAGIRRFCPELAVEEGRADRRGRVGRQAGDGRFQRTAASIATATNRSAR